MKRWKSWLKLLALALLTLGLAACQSDEAPPAAATQPAPASTYFPFTLGEQTIQIQLAITPDEQQRGLMYRESMPEDHGMLFVFEQPGPRSFWMANTKIPLDIAYITPDGMIREIYPMYPLDTSSVPSRRKDILYALEMNQGWFRAHGIRAGHSLHPDELAAALAQRQ